MKLVQPYLIFYKDPARALREHRAPDTDYMHLLHTGSGEEAQQCFSAFVQNFGNNGEYNFRLVDLNDMPGDIYIQASCRPNQWDALNTSGECRECGGSGRINENGEADDCPTCNGSGKKRKQLVREKLTVNICERCFSNIGQFPLFVEHPSKELGIEAEMLICQKCMEELGGRIASSDDGVPNPTRTKSVSIRR